MTDATARFALPLIAAGQAQKEVFHNEALMRIDALLEPVVEAVMLDDPPASPDPGQCWVVGAAPSGAWAGEARAIAAWSEGGWRFLAPAIATTVWSRAEALFARFDGSDWILGEIRASRVLVGGVQVVGMQQSAVAPPAGGTVVDGEARNAVAAIIAVLKSHGLTA
jgi:hypothetical protein